MMSPRTLRRKLQKKAKRKPFRKCPRCSGRMAVSLIEGDYDGWHLYAHCGEHMGSRDNFFSRETLECLGLLDVYNKSIGCGYFYELFVHRCGQKLINA